MKVVVATHHSVLDHDTGPLHPERPERVASAWRGVRSSGVEVVEIEAPAVDRSVLTTVHDPVYVDAIEAFCRTGGGALDFDTIVSPSSWEAALRSVGAVEALVEEVDGRPDAFGLALTRPPGHHALRDRAMGFCLFNNVAVAAASLRKRGQRVAILDWDVHHGNGTQQILGTDAGVLYVSIHQEGFYPFEGHTSDIELMAVGTNVNIPLRPGTGGDVVRRAWDELVMPVVGQFEPDWVLISAGYDGHVDDPLADMALVADDYGWMARRLREAHDPGRVVLALEGGYDLVGLEQSVAATMRGMSGAGTHAPATVSPPGCLDALDRAGEAIGRHWKV